MAEAAQTGRPSKYDPAFCEEVISFLADGYSMSAFAGHIGVAASTVQLWQQEHPEFSVAVKTARAKAVLWWENRARAIARGEDGNATAVIFGLKNRAADDWRDKTETALTGAEGGAIRTETKLDVSALSAEQLRALSSIKVNP